MIDTVDSSARRTGFTHQPGLDGLRALAVATVVTYHLGYQWASGGFLGVDTFFVLSGFLITSLLLAEKLNTEAISVPAFWVRRARRLLPAFFVMLTAVCLYAAGTVPSVQLSTLRNDAISSIFYFANWHFIAANQSYFDLFVAPLPLNHLWSLAIEEQFYLLWPLALIGLLRIGHGRLRTLVIATTLGIVASQIAMSVLYSPGNPSRAYFGTESRAHTLLIGCLAATLLRARPDFPARAGAKLQWCGMLALAGCFVAFNSGDTSSAYFNGGSLAFSIAVSIVIIALIAPGGLLRHTFSIRPLRYIGRISYGIYLWHWPLIVFMTEEKIGLAGNMLNAARVVATVVVAAASFRFIEQPILQRQTRLARIRVLVPIGLSLVLASVFIGTAGATTQEKALGRLAGGVRRCGPAPQFEVRAARSELRHLGRLVAQPTATPRRVAVFGDSRACSLLTGLEVGGREIHAKVSNGALLGCGIVAGTISPRSHLFISRAWAKSCLARVNHLVDTVVAESRPDVIVWFSGWEVYDLTVGNHAVTFGSAEHRQLLLSRMEDLYQRARAPGRKLVILTMPEQVDRKPFFVDTQANSRIPILNQIYRQFAAQHPNDVAIIDFARRVCPKVRRCSPTRDGIEPRALDGAHFTPQGSAWAAAWIWPKLLTGWPTPAPIDHPSPANRVATAP